MKDLTVLALIKKLQDDIAKFKATPGPKGDKGDKGDSIKGEQGDRGLPGYEGKDGKDGVDGQKGKDGKDGVSVVDVKLDPVDNSFVVYLSDGTEIEAGQLNLENVNSVIQKVVGGGSGGSGGGGFQFPQDLHYVGCSPIYGGRYTA